MKRSEYQEIERYMLECMCDTAHDQDHIYRVLGGALQIAKTCEAVEMDVLIAACLLHDIGREAQFQNEAICHAQAGARMAFDFLTGRGWDVQKAGYVQDCVRTHRFRGNDQPVTIEAKILFDADKLDVAGALGIARTLTYGGQVGRALYTRDDLIGQGDGISGDRTTFVGEYRFKLAGLYDKFYTKEGQRLAKERQSTATAFFEGLLREIKSLDAEREALVTAEFEQG